MKKSLLFISGFLIITVALSAGGGSKNNLKEVKDDKYQPGQVWSYKSRPGEESSTLTILRVEESPQGKRIVHIHVDGIRLKNCTGGPAPDTVAHMPFARESLDASVTQQIRKGSVPPFKDGYSDWRKGWDEGKAGFYTITVAQAVDTMQATFAHGLGCPQ
jgi:hypothetical protein